MYLQSMNIHRHTVNQKPERKNRLMKYSQNLCAVPISQILRRSCVSLAGLDSKASRDETVELLRNNLSQLVTRAGRASPYTRAAANASYDRTPC